MARKIPASAGNNQENKSKKNPISNAPDFQSYHPCWRFGNFDFGSKWGLVNLLGKFKFIYTEDLLSEIINSNLDSLDKILTNINGKEFETLDNLWSHINQCGHTVSIEIIRLISKSLSRTVFFDKIYPKLQTYEKNTWDEIRLYSHGNGKSNNHNVSIQNLCKEAQDRLEYLGFSDRSEIYSLRLEGKIRIYGFKELNYLDIIWVDLSHEIYPCDKD